MANKMTVKKGTVKIRMYNTEFGDCFLIGFPSNNGDPKYMLIDFGMHHSTDDKVNKLKKIARNLKTATGGKIDLLVVTHEHTDHIDGFKSANEIFRQIKVKNIWMGWTENYDDPKVKKLDKIKHLYIQALEIAVKKLENVKPTLAANIESVLRFNIDENHFFGLDSQNNKYNPEKEKPSTNRETMTWLKHHAATLKYCTPGGESLTCDEIEGINFYVMGPPTLEQKGRLKKSSPSKGSKKETYLSDDIDDVHLKFAIDTILAADPSNTNIIKDALPSDLEKQKPFADSYEMSDQAYAVVSHYSDSKNKWRQIDDTLLDMAESLAIKLNSHTNNSSLVLAIEIGDNGKVLLFPGDAQVGNWLGWGDLTWEVGTRKIKKDDLLKRTVFYKVGHHGSHNATLKKEGLEKMIHPDLAAMIPVDHKFAVTQDWDIPYPKLTKRLKSKCKSRVLRSDRKLPSEKPYSLSDIEWAEFRKSIKRNTKEKYIELTINC